MKKVIVYVHGKGGSAQEANYPDSLKKDYVPFEESNVKFYKSGINAKVQPNLK